MEYIWIILYLAWTLIKMHGNFLSTTTFWYWCVWRNYPKSSKQAISSYLQNKDKISSRRPTDSIWWGPLLVWRLSGVDFFLSILIKALIRMITKWSGLRLIILGFLGILILWCLAIPPAGKVWLYDPRRCCDQYKMRGSFRLSKRKMFLIRLILFWLWWSNIG